jgi:hypothetical protein
VEAGVLNVLGELQRIHAELLQLIADHETMTREAAPPADLAKVRYKLMCASTNRNRYLETSVYVVAIEKASGANLEGVLKLGTQATAQFLRMVDYIGKWDMPRIRSNWRDYCAASRELRADMRRRIADEQQVLYPLL